MGKMKMLRLIILITTITLSVALPFLGPQLDWDERIIGGSNANDGDAPYQVSLRSDSNPNFHFCGASIIGTRWILSAAHCTINRVASQSFVVVGTVLIKPLGKSYRVSQIINHPEYDASIFLNDISLLQVTEDIQQGPNVQIIGLHEQAIPGGELAIVTGWGQTTNPGSAPNNLQIIQLQTLSTAECKKRHGSNGQFVTERNICSFTRKGEGVCFGDSGGPLIVNGKQEGIANWVAGGCAAGYPDAFARVSYFRNWIKEVSGV